MNVAALHWPFLAGVLHTVPLSSPELAVVVSCSVVTVPLVEIAKLVPRMARAQRAA